MKRPEGLYRLRFINGKFDKLLRVPNGESLVEWRNHDRDEIRSKLGHETTVAYMTTKILRQWDDDSDIVLERRKSIPQSVFDHFGIPSTRNMDEIVDNFNNEFAAWSISLPPQDIAQRKRGRITKKGWAIWYLFGADEIGEYLDYYASHRMTNDRHVRIRVDGKCKALPAILDFRTACENPKEDARLEAEYQTKNRIVNELLQAKGFGLQGGEPGGAQMNRYLRLNNLDNGNKDS